jgi:3-deoxy-manno-octulosonate cytidylyltransferase (CMP-KDO synthetase)
LDYKSIITIDEENNDNSVVMMINYILQKDFKDVEIAGVDGFIIDENNYNYNELDSVVDKEAIKSLNEYILSGLKLLSNKINISFLTDSLFKDKLKKRVIGIIPARFASTRLPGKPLVDINGLPMIIHVLKRTLMSKCLDDVIVATDDKRILDTVIKFGGKAVLTSETHNNGSERMYEVSQSFNADIYVLINGDEALLNPNHIDLGVQALSNNPSSGVSLLYNKFEKRNSVSDFKVVVNNKKEIMYISRSDIPSENRNNIDYLLKAYHIITFTKEMLEIYSHLKQTEYDFTESHELLRLLENSYKIQGVEVDSSAISVDIKEDLEFVRDMMNTDKLFPLYRDI